MTDATHARRLRIWGLLALAAFTLGLGWIAARLMFSAFMFYDDEGYVLISLKNFAEHGGLYRNVYSQYGPFPFVVYYLLHGAGVAIDHLTGRTVTLVAWAAAALLSALLVRRVTRNFLASVATLVATFPYLWIMVSEPSHPGGLITLLVALAAVLGSSFLLREKPTGWAWTVGAIAAAVVFTKINVGGFIILSALAWILLHHENEIVRRRAPAILIAGVVLVLVALMRPMLGMPWVQVMGLVVASSAAAAALAYRAESTHGVTWGTLVRCIVSGIATTLLILGVILARGTSPGDVLEGVLLGPLRHPAAFNLSYTWPPGALTFAVVSLVSVVVAKRIHRRAPVRIDRMVAILRIAAAAAAAATVLRFPSASPDRWVFGYGAPLLWLFVWRLPGEDKAAQRVIPWLALLWLGQFLHAFPVAGSQIAWGTFLVLPLVAIGTWSTLGWCHGLLSTRASTAPGRATFATQIVVLVLALAMAIRFYRGGERYREGSNLALPGAVFLRLPDSATALFRALALNAAAHGDMLFSEPGMFSLNFWSGLPPPTLSNVTHWFSLLSPERQRAIIASLEQHPRAVVILQREHIAYLTRRSFAPAGELHDYIAKNFTPAFVLDDFEFRVRRGRTIDPLLLGEMLLLSEERGAPNTALRVRLPLAPGISVARVELYSPARPHRDLLYFDRSNARVEITPADGQGRPTGVMRAADWPFVADAASVIAIHFDRFAQIAPSEDSVIRCLDASGREVALARLKR